MIKFLIFITILISAHEINLSQTTIVPSKADTCEISVAKLDAVRNIITKEKVDTKLILISRPGKKENSSYLEKRRLYAIKKYLIDIGVSDDKIITAQSIGMKDLGIIEIYVSGGLFEIIIADRNKDIPVGRCEDTKEDKKRYQLP